MKVLCMFFLMISIHSYGQLISGAAKNEGRVVTSETPYVTEGTIDGWATYEVAINREGEVTSARILETNIKRTSALMQLQNYAKTFTFTPGTYYPKFHHATLKLTLVKPKEETPNEN